MKEKRKIRSMTGYGRGECTENGIRCLAEIRSVNHRFLEIVVRMPSGWIALEEAVKRTVRSAVRRGRVDVFITVEGAAEQRSVHVDWQLAESIVEASEKMKRRFGMTGSITMGELLRLPEVMKVSEPQIDPEQHSSPLLQAVREACDALLEMRVKEGAVLAGDLSGRIDTLMQYVAEIRKRAPIVVEHYRERMHLRLREFLAKADMDEERLMAEAAIFAEKSDIQEELTRIESHARQFLQTLKMEGPVGRRLDFLLQEMNREVNTIGSKANDQQISARVVDCKSELEKMREQVQNIE